MYAYTYNSCTYFKLIIEDGGVQVLDESIEGEVFRRHGVKHALRNKVLIDNARFAISSCPVKKDVLLPFRYS